MSKELRDVDYLEHILQAIQRINRYVEDVGEPGFLQDDKTQDASFGISKSSVRRLPNSAQS